MIELRGVSKRYDARTVVDDVSLVIEPRTVAGIVGTSGSGKTTVLRMINRLAEPSAGTILIDGVDTRTLPGFELRRRIGYVIQNDGLFPHRTVRENIATVPRLLGWSRGEIARRVDELLELFQLDPAVFAARFPHELSGGQRQRVGVARALAARPNILLMDEPFGALDPVIRAKAQDDLLHIQRATQTTIVLVTHDMDEAIRLADRIAVMADGRVVQFGTPEDLLARPATPFVERMVGVSDRSFRLLSLMPLERFVEFGTDAASDVEPLELDAALDAREALSRLLWVGAREGRVRVGAGGAHGRIRTSRLLDAARGASTP